MIKKVCILGLVVISIVLLFVGIPVTAKNISIPLAAEDLPVSVWKPGETDYNLELNVVTDQDQIRKELEAIGIDYDKAIDELEKQTEGPGGHAGVMWCPGPKKAGDLFLTSPGPYIVGFYGGGGGAIGGCVGGGTCNSFPACLINAVCYVPFGQTVALYSVNAIATTDLGPSCIP
jgi:hypothetical protein